MTDHLTDILGPLDGAQIPGGCDTCPAYQTIDPLKAGIWQLTIHHDPNCPTLTRHTQRNQ